MGKRQKREAVAQTQAEVVWATAQPLNATTRNEYDYGPFLKFLQEGKRKVEPLGPLGKWQKPDYKYRDREFSLVAAWYDIPREGFWVEVFLDAHNPTPRYGGRHVCDTCVYGEFSDPEEWPCNEADRFLKKTGAY